MTRPAGALEVRLREALINSHGGPMREHTVQEWRTWLGHLVDEQSLDLIRFCEVTDRIHRAAVAALGRDWDVVRRDARAGSDEVMLAVRKTPTTRVQSSRSLPMGGGRWRGAHTGRLHTPRQMLEVVIDLDVCDHIAAVVHAPPGIDVDLEQQLPAVRRRGLRKVSRRITIIRGKADRVLAWRRYWRRFRRWAAGVNRLGVTWSGGGDLQERRDSRGWTSPVDTAARVGGTTVIRGIDGWIVGDGVRVVDVTQVSPGPGMDHPVPIGTLVINPRGASA